MLLFLMLACDGDATEPKGAFEISVTAGDPGTVAVVSWTTATPGTSQVEFGTSNAYGQVTPGGTELTTDHKVMVVGMPASCDCHLRAFSEDASGERQESGDHLFETADPDPDLATLTTDVNLPSADAAPLMLTTVSTRSGVVIVNGDSEILWWRAFPSTATGTQARPSDDGLYAYFDSADSAHEDGEASTITRVRLDGAEEVVTYDTSGHHDFFPLEDGNYVYLQADIREIDYGGDGTVDRVVGDAVVEVAPDGTLIREVWNAWDWLTPDYVESSPFYPGALDWTHLNGIYATDDAYYVSSHNLNTILKIDRATGALVWQMGGDGMPEGHNDFTFLDDTQPFGHQHSPRWIDGHLYVFNNTLGEERPPASYAAEYEVDETAMTVKEIRRYDRDGSSFSYVLGNIDVQDSGNWLVNWGTVGVVEEVDPTDAVLRSLKSGIGFPVGNAHYTAPLGGPIP